MAAADHPLFAAIEPLLRAMGATVVEPDDIGERDVPIEWDDAVIGGVRLASLSDALERMVAHIEQELGGPLADLGRVEKQAAVRMLDERGAFHLRRAIDSIADLMGVSRITIYNYLNAIRKD
ncbi:MAG: helix-turn-helix domain-containing protein [Acidimicrobiia bacterium]